MLCLTVYCDSAHCKSPVMTSAEIELPINLEDYAPNLQEMEARTVEVLQGLGWLVELDAMCEKPFRLHICPECAKEER